MLFKKKSRTNTRTTAGFTLIELLVTIAIAGIILMVGIPNLTQFMISSRLDNGVLELQRLVLSTRNAAISSELNVTMCPLNSALTCSTNWQNEISVFIDNDGDNTYEQADGDRIIKTRAAIHDDDSISTTVSRLTYSATGTLTGVNSNINFIYCPSDSSIPARAVTVSSTGRPYISQDSNNDGFDEDRSGTKVSCN